MAYMDKPSIIYVPGKNEVKSQCKNYHIENLNYPHMCYCNTKDDLFKKLNDIVGAEVNQKISTKTFKFVDMNNTQRLVQWMQDNLQKVRKESCVSFPNPRKP